MRTFLGKLLLAGGLLAASGFALAGSATANLAVSASVSANCTISTSALAFGAYDPVSANSVTDLNGTGSVSVACTKGASGLSIGLNNGNNASGSQRQMKSGSDLLQYNLYQPPSNTPNTACSFPGTTAWGTTIGTNTLSLTNAPDKNARTYNVCGTVPQAQDVPAGSYSDTVTATINF